MKFLKYLFILIFFVLLLNTVSAGAGTQWLNSTVTSDILSSNATFGDVNSIINISIPYFTFEAVADGLSNGSIMANNWFNYAQQIAADPNNKMTATETTDFTETITDVPYGLTAYQAALISDGGSTIANGQYWWNVHRYRNDTNFTNIKVTSDNVINSVHINETWENGQDDWYENYTGTYIFPGDGYINMTTAPGDLISIRYGPKVFLEPYYNITATVNRRTASSSPVFATSDRYFNGYAVYLYDAANLLILFRLDEASTTVIGTSSQVFTEDVNYTYTYQRSGSTHNVYDSSGSLLITATDNTYYAPSGLMLVASDAEGQNCTWYDVVTYDESDFMHNWDDNISVTTGDNNLSFSFNTNVSDNTTCKYNLTGTSYDFGTNTTEHNGTIPLSEIYIGDGCIYCNGTLSGSSGCLQLNSLSGETYVPPIVIIPTSGGGGSRYIIDVPIENLAMYKVEKIEKDINFMRNVINIAIGIILLILFIILFMIYRRDKD